MYKAETGKLVVFSLEIFRYLKTFYLHPKTNAVEPRSYIFMGPAAKNKTYYSGKRKIEVKGKSIFHANMHK